MREFAIFLIIFAVLAALLTGVIWLLGGPFGFRFADSWYLSLVALVFIFPGVGNVHIFASLRSPQSAPRRLCALIRGIGMLVAAAACLIPMLTRVATPSIVLWGVTIGMLMNFGTLPFDDRLRRKR